MFFEGSEKKLEISVSQKGPSLRSLGRPFWEQVVAATQAQILSQISNEHCDSYLLSESSLFVFDHNIVLITCGQTHLIGAVEVLLSRFSKDEITALFYERKHEVFPRRQPTSFTDDAKKLNEIFPGKAYRFGDESEHFISLYHLDKPYQAEKDDLTLEILMHGIPLEVSQALQLKSGEDKRALCKEMGIYDIIGDFQVDDYFFDPMGYSLNAIRNEDYYTIHFTPQEVGSFVSFETNYNYRDKNDLQQTIDKVLKIFQPKSVDIMNFDSNGLEKVELGKYQLQQEVIEKIDSGFHVGFYHYSMPGVKKESAQRIEI